MYFPKNQKNKKTKKQFLILISWFIVFLFSCIPFGSNAANSATLYMTSAKTQYAVGEHIYIKVRVNPGTEDINVVRANLTYNSDVALFQNYSVDGAWPYASPGNSSSPTSASIGGFILASVITNDSQFATLDFLAQAPGFLTLTPENTSLLIDNNMVNQISTGLLAPYSVEVVGALPPPPSCEQTNTCPPPPPPGCEQTNSCPPPTNQAPIINDLGEQIGYIGQVLNFTVSATDPEGGNVTLSASGLPNGAEFYTQTGVLAWSPNQQGIYSVTFTATDDNNPPASSSKTVRIIVFCSSSNSNTCAEVSACINPDEIAPTVTSVCEIIPLQFEEKSARNFDLFPHSTSHPNQEKWYGSNLINLQWLSDAEAIGYVFNLDGSEGGEPANGYQNILDTKVTFRDVPDGRWFFHIKARYEDGWGKTYHFKINIDTESPNLIVTDITKKNGQINLNFNARDNLSGLANYQYKISGDWQTVEPPLQLDQAVIGEFVNIRAIDRAANVAEATISLSILEEVGDQKEYSILVAEQDDNKISPPQISKVIYYLASFDPFPNHAVVFSGSAVPNSIVTVYFSHDSKLFVTTQANDAGRWEAIFKTFIPPGGYKVFAVAEKGRKKSVPSEVVQFELKDGIGGETFAWSAFAVGVILTLVIIYALKSIWSTAFVTKLLKK